MRFLLVLLSLLMLVSCGQLSTKGRYVASGPILRKFFETALETGVKNGDNLAYKSVKEMESKILKEIQLNPSKFGIPDSVDVKAIKSLDDLPGERYIAEIIAQAPYIFKFSSKMKAAAFDIVKNEAGIAARISFSSANLSSVKVYKSEITGLGRTVDKQIKNLHSELVSKGVKSADADAIVKELRESAKDLAAKAKLDKKLKPVAKQIIDYSTIITQKTGKRFLGPKGCFKISGSDVLANKAEIAYRTMREVEEKGLKNYTDIGPALQKHHSEVTNRTMKESRAAMCQLAGGATSGCGVYAKGLRPTSC